MIAALEEGLQPPVLTANQVLFWYALRRSGSGIPVEGYGRVFAEQLPTERAASDDLAEHDCRAGH